MGTPSNKKDTDRTIELSSGNLLTAEDGEGYDLLELGILTSNGYSKPDGSYSFTRNAKKSMGVPINDLFMFTGSICYFGIPPGDWDSCNAEDPEDTESPCRNFEGTVCCTPVIDTDTGETIGHVEDTCVLPELDGTCDDVDKELFDVYCQYYDNVWIFGIADLVEYYFGVVNDGVKLIQIRFYPICDLAQQ